MSTFSSDGASSMERKVDIIGDSELTNIDLLEYSYEIERCAEWIKEIAALKVCLQFPDALLGDSVNVALRLEKLIEGKVYILGDTSYGSCCVDEVAAQHVSADAIIHFGNACLSPTSRLPTLYIFEKNAVDVNKFESSFRDTFKPDCKLIILYEVCYLHIIEKISENLSTHYPSLVISKLSTDQTSNPDHTKKLGREFKLADGATLDEYTIVFIGKDGRTLSNFFMDMIGPVFYVFDPRGSGGLEAYAYERSRFLMRRSHLVERVKDAGALGIVVGTLGVASYLAAIQRVKQLAMRCGKKSYIIAVGKPNVPKLANFPEVDVFVLVACPENSLLDWKEGGYEKPIVTPYDVELALNTPRTFAQTYVADFRQLLIGGSAYQAVDAAPRPDDDGATDVSLVSGRLRDLAPHVDPAPRSDGSDSVAVRGDMTVCAPGSGGVFLAARSWHGLQQSLGETPVELAEQGRTGIPQDYSELEAQ